MIRILVFSLLAAVAVLATPREAAAQSGPCGPTQWQTIYNYVSVQPHGDPANDEAWLYYLDYVFDSVGYNCEQDAQSYAGNQGIYYVMQNCSTGAQIAQWGDTWTCYNHFWVEWWLTFIEWMGAA